MSLVSTISSGVNAAKSALGDVVVSFTLTSVVSTYIDGENQSTETVSSVDGVFIDVNDTYFDDTIAHEAEYMLILFSGSIDKSMEVTIDGAKKSIISMNKVRTGSVTHITIVAVK